MELGIPSPDHLMHVISRTQLLGWMVYSRIRGPIGPPRQDRYNARLAMFAGGPYGEDVAKKISDDDFLPVWAKEAAAFEKMIAAEEAAKE